MLRGLLCAAALLAWPPMAGAQGGTWVYQGKDVHRRPLNAKAGPDGTLVIEEVPVDPPRAFDSRELTFTFGDGSASSNGKSTFWFGDADGWAYYSSTHTWTVPPKSLRVGASVRLQLGAKVTVKPAEGASQTKMQRWFEDNIWEATTTVVLYQNGAMLLEEGSAAAVRGEGANDQYGKFKTGWHAPRPSSEVTLTVPAGERDGEELIVAVDADMAESDRVVYYRYRLTGVESAGSSGATAGGTEAETESPPGPADPPTPTIDVSWKVAVGGGAALAAAAAGLAGAYWRRRRAKGDNSTTPPDGPVGHVLQLSNDRFVLASGESVVLTATVWAVDHTGATSLAGGAPITVSAPEGITVAPASGAGRLVTHLSGAASLAEGTHAVHVSAQAGGSTYQATVSITAGKASAYAISLDQTAVNLTQNGAESVRARVVVTGPDAEACEAESQRLTAAVAFALTGSCAGWFSARDSYEGGSRVGILDLTIPDNIAKLQGPFTATYTASVMTPTGKVSQACVLTVSPSAQFELAMDPVLRLTANDVAGSLLCCIVCKDPTITDAAALIKAATPGLRFAVSGNQSQWLNERGGKPGVLTGAVSGGSSPGKEVHPQADVPESDLGEAAPFTATITASVTIPRYGAFSQVARVDIAPPKWFVEIQPVKDQLKAGINDAAEFRVRVLPALDVKLPAYTHDGVNGLNQYLEFGLEGPAAKFALLGELEGDGEFRRIEVRLAEVPKGTPIGEYLDVVAEAPLCGQRTRQKFRIVLSGKPELEVKEKALSLVSDGPSTTVHAKVKNGDEFTWAMRVETFDLPFAKPDGPPESPDGHTFTLGLCCSEMPDGHFGFVNGILRLSAHATNPETQEEIWTEPVDLKVKLGRVGLSVSPSPVRLPPSPTSPPAVFRVRVVRFNTQTQAFESVPSAMAALEMDDWEDGDAADGGNIFKGAGVTLTATGKFEGSGADQSALWHAKTKLVIPAATIVDALRTLTAPGDYGDEQDLFTTQHTFFAPIDPAAVASDKIRVEQENCRKVLRFMPEGEQKTRFAGIIENDARMLGADGLRHLRTKVWIAARNSLSQEATSYLRWSKWWDGCAVFFDWTQYVCGLMLQAIASVALPFPADLVVGVLYTATPDLVNAVHSGESVESWVKNWARSFYEGLPGMGADMALGMAVDIEELVKAGLKQFKDLRKACLAACIVFWEVRFFRHMSVPKADGEPHSVVEAVTFALRDLAEEVLQKGIGKNARFHAEKMKLPGVTGWVKDYDSTTGHGYDPKDGRVYHEGTEPPDTRGMPKENLKAAQDIAKKNNVEIYVRPTNAASKTLLEQGALPKSEKIKSKTINKYDILLGCRKEDLGKVGSFNPKRIPDRGDLSAKEYESLMDRFHQRQKEFTDNGGDFAKLRHEHPVMKNGKAVDGVTERITVDQYGVVTNHTTRVGPDGTPVTTSKVYTGDHDIYDIRGKDGRPLEPAEYDRIVKELQDSKFQAQHPGHRQWDYTTKPLPDPVAEQARKKKFAKNKGIDEKIKDSHQSSTDKGEPGESIIKIGSEGSLTGVFANPPKVAHTTGGRAGMAGSQSNARNEREREGA